MRETHNPNCDGAHCRNASAETRKLPYGPPDQHGNLIFCRDCYRHELSSRGETEPAWSDLEIVSPDQYELRIALERIVRAAGQEPRQGGAALDAQVLAVAHVAPAVVARGVDSLVDKSAKAWERGNNSGSSQLLEEGQARSQSLARVAETIMELFGATADWPGLYPTWTVCGREYYGGSLGAVKAGSEVRQ